MGKAISEEDGQPASVVETEAGSHSVGADVGWTASPHRCPSYQAA